jgi:micrococcal nuclease
MGNSHKKNTRLDRGRVEAFDPIKVLLATYPELVKDVPLKGENIPVRVCDIHDGDTVKILLIYGTKPLKINLRLMGIDTPEITSGKGRLPEEKTAAIMARRRLAELVDDNIMYATIHDWDKFGGRLVGELFTPEGASIGEMLLREGYAREYDGEKKRPWRIEDLGGEPYNVI